MADQATRILSVQLDADKAINGIVRLNDAIEANNRQMALNRKQIQENNQAMRDGSKDTQKATAENLQLAKSNEQLLVETKQLKDEKRGLQKEVQNEIRQQSELNGSLRGLRAELSNLTKQYDSLSRVERENGKAGKELKQRINEVTSELKNAEEGTQRYYRNVGNYQNAILNTIGLNNRFVQSFMAMSGTTATGSVAMSQAFAGIGASAKALGASLMSLMSNPVFLAIAGIAGAGVAFKWFYDYNMGVAEATRQTREFTKLAGQDLSDLRAEIQATANTYGKDYKDVLQAVDTLMSHYDITGKKAIDTINDGFQAGADLNGDMLQKLQQYAPTFRDAGISADRFMAIITQTRSGIFSEQGLDAIKQGSARIREMSNTTRTALQKIGIDVDEMQAKLRSGQMDTFDAIQQVANKLKELPDNAQEVGEVMSAVFGRQGKFASQEMIESIGSMVTEIEKLKQTTGEYGELTDELREKEVELQKAMADVFGTGNEGFEEMTIKAEILAKDGLTSVVKGFKDVVLWIKKTWNENAILRAGVAHLAVGFRTLFFVVTRVTSLIITGIKGAIDALSVLSQSFGIVAKNIATAFSGVADIFRGIANRDADQIASGVKKAGGAVMQSIGNLAKGIGSAVGAGYESIVSSIFDRVKSAFNVGSWYDGITDFRFEIDNVNEGLEETSSIFSNIVTQATNAVKSTFNTGKKKKNDDDEDDKNKPLGSDKSKGGTTTSNADTEAERAEKQRQAKIQALIKQGEELARKSYEEEAKKTEDGIIEMYNKRADLIMQKFAEVEVKSIEEENALATAQSAMLQANLEEQNRMIEDLQRKREEKERNETEKSRAMAKQIAQTWLESTEEGTTAYYNYMLEILRQEKEAELALYENNGQMKNAIVAKYAKQEDDIRRQQAAHTIEIEEQKMTAVGSIAGALSGMMESFGEDSKEAVALAKALALAEMMINQAVAISGAIRKATTDPTSYTVFGMIATIAGAIAAVVGSMVQAFTSLDSAKFATGGYIQGAGTGTSDSIPVRVSNGESIMNANTTAMFSGLLSSLNQLGGGVPIQAQQTAQSVRGEDMLARAFARGVAMLPAPVVSVQDINRGQRQVEVMNERATL